MLAADTVRVEACRNGQCWQAQLASNPNGQVQSLSFNENGDWYATLQLRVEPSNWYVTVEFPVKNYSDVVVGDALKLTFTDANGKQLYTVSGTTNAPMDSYPNGPDCEPSPCRQATAEISEP